MRLGQKAAAVLDNVCVYGPGTRAELSVRCGMPINCICGRVNELVQIGALKEVGTTTDPTTLKQVKVLAVPWEEQNEKVEPAAHT